MQEGDVQGCHTGLKTRRVVGPCLETGPVKVSSTGPDLKTRNVVGPGIKSESKSWE